jgi:hypothetical protein
MNFIIISPCRIVNVKQYPLAYASRRNIIIIELIWQAIRREIHFFFNQSAYSTFSAGAAGVIDQDVDVIKCRECLSNDLASS